MTYNDPDAALQTRSQSEINAMTIIVRALDTLDDAQRARVIRWAADRYANMRHVGDT